MKFSFFESVKHGLGQVCTYNTFLDATESKSVEAKAIAIKKGSANKDKLKSELPAVTWQAYFPNGKRISREAIPSGLYMLDIDHIDNPNQIYIEKIAGRLSELDIVLVHVTISTHGLRIVAQCQPQFDTIEANQRWLASELGLDYDGVCKDWARASFLVPYQYFLFMEAGLFNPEVPAKFVPENREAQMSPETEVGDNGQTQISDPNEKTATPVDMQKEYKGISLNDIALEWLRCNGGMPEEGERNAKLYKLALRMRYITDFSPCTIAAVIPHCGLTNEEVMQLAKSACSGNRSGDMPYDMQQIIYRLTQQDVMGSDEPLMTENDFIIDTEKTPPLPPIFKEYNEIAPDDFKQAVVLCLLPLVGTLGSKLRAVYLSGKAETPSFMVALEAPQASGKSFAEILTTEVLKPMIVKDEEERQKERDFDEQIKIIKLQGSKNTKGEREQIKELMEHKPQPIIRKIPATASITKLLMRIDMAQGLHVFAFAPEIDTVTKAFKRGFSNLSDLQRCAFDNSEFGQDYASDTSFSGNVKIFYNTLYSGTPGAMRRFYTNSEDGTMSRTLFVTLPDQFGKKMPVWGKLSKEQQMVVDTSITKLYEVSIEGDDVKPEHMMAMDFLNNAFSDWIEQQRQLSVKYNDRTRNIFYRRCAELGFRAGMVAFYLYNEDKSKSVRKKVCQFSIWVANMMLKQFIGRVVLTDELPENLFARSVFVALPDEFTREQLIEQLQEQKLKSAPKVVLCRWRAAGKIKGEKYNGQMFVKVK